MSVLLSVGRIDLVIVEWILRAWALLTACLTRSVRSAGIDLGLLGSVDAWSMLALSVVNVGE